MVLIPPTKPPSGGRTLGNHEARIRVLERSPRQGWRFDTDNEGGWGYVFSNDSTDIDYGEYGMALGDKSGEGALFLAQDVGNTMQSLLSLTTALVNLSTTDGDMQLYAAAGAITLTANAGLSLEGDTGITTYTNQDWGNYVGGSFDFNQAGTTSTHFDIQSQGDDGIGLHAFGGDLFGESGSGDVVFKMGGGVGSMFRLTDGSNNAIFEVVITAGVPTYHIKTGATWVADL